MIRWFNTLFNRMIILTGALTLVSLTITQIYFRNHERTILQMNLQQLAEYTADLYVRAIGDALNLRDDVMLQQIVTRMENDKNIASVIVVDAQSRLRYHMDPEQIGNPFEDEILKRSLESGEAVATHTMLQGYKAMTLVYPLNAKGQARPLGAVRVEYTYKPIEDTVRKGIASFYYVSVGILSFMVGGVLWGFRKWVVRPLTRLRAAIGNVNAATLEANFPETPSEFGEVNQTLNQLLMRIRSEWDAQRAGHSVQADSERRWVERLALSFMPDIRILAADRDNRILTDTGVGIGGAAEEARSGGALASAVGKHLLDLLSDPSFGQLLSQAFQKEGQVVQGSVQFQGRMYAAAIVRAPEEEARLVKTVIALRPTA